jgi:hypothetical protein
MSHPKTMKMKSLKKILSYLKIYKIFALLCGMNFFGYYLTLPKQPDRQIKPTPQPVTEAPRQPKMTATRQTARPKKTETKSTAATKPAAGKSKKKAAASVKTASANLSTSELVVPTQNPISPLEDISDLLDRLPLQACVELTRRAHLLPPHRGSPPAGCFENRHFLRGRIWQHALGDRYGIKPCALPAGMLTECAAESLSWSSFSASTVSIFVS